VGVDMTEVDGVDLQLITASRLATSATAAGSTAASAAGGGGAAGSYVAAIVDVIGGRVAFTFSEVQNKTLLA
jgi:hypothetical protein